MMLERKNGEFLFPWNWRHIVSFSPAFSPRLVWPPVKSASFAEHFRKITCWRLGGLLHSSLMWPFSSDGG